MYSRSCAVLGSLLFVAFATKRPEGERLLLLTAVGAIVFRPHGGRYPGAALSRRAGEFKRAARCSLLAAQRSLAAAGLHLCKPRHEYQIGFERF